MRARTIRRRAAGRRRIRAGFQMEQNNFVFCCNCILNALDPDGCTVSWIEEESTYSPNTTYSRLPATNFFWDISHNGTIVNEGSFTGTFKQMYDNSGTDGFVTWRGLNSSNFGQVYGLDLVSQDGSNNWSKNGWTVSAGFLENAGVHDADLETVNSRINPLGAATTRNTLRGLSTYLYQTLVNDKADYNGDLYYE